MHDASTPSIVQSGGTVMARVGETASIVIVNAARTERNEERGGPDTTPPMGREGAIRGVAIPNATKRGKTQAACPTMRGRMRG
jgi:hypothetical protein